MKRSSAVSGQIENLLATFQAQEPDLEFPVAPEFYSKPPRLPWPVIFKRSEANLRYKLRQPGFHQTRLVNKCVVEFEL